MALEIYQFSCLSDNYGVLIHDSVTGMTASIDAPEEDAVLSALSEKGWDLSHILTTHHHADHTDGHLGLKSRFGCEIVGPLGEASKIPGIDVSVQEGDVYDFSGHSARIIETPGHTLGHIAYYFADDGVVFVGDTLFALGCGRVFEGTFAQMFSSLDTLRALPPETVVYCGHEYTQSNARFALGVDGSNESLRLRSEEIDRLRSAGLPTLPTTIGLERETNPFLRYDDPVLCSFLGLSGSSSVDVFSELRRRKDSA